MHNLTNFVNFLLDKHGKSKTYPQLKTTLRIKLIPLLLSVKGKKHSSINDMATASMELHSILSPSVNESESDRWIRDHENPESSSCFTPISFRNGMYTCKIQISEVLHPSWFMKTSTTTRKQVIQTYFHFFYKHSIVLLNFFSN